MWFLRGCVEAIRAFWENIVDLQLDFAKKKNLSKGQQRKLVIFGFISFLRIRKSKVKQ